MHHHEDIGSEFCDAVTVTMALMLALMLALM